MELTGGNFLRLSTHEADKAINRRCRVGNFDDVRKRQLADFFGGLGDNLPIPTTVP